MKIHKLTEAGLNRFQQWLADAKERPESDPPGELLTGGGGLNEVIEGSRSVDPQVFASRLAFASYIDEAVMVQYPVLERDPGFWAWLTIFYFDQVCPKIDGFRRIGAFARYLPSFEDYKRYYRHLLLGPWLIYRAHRENPSPAMPLLTGALSTPGELVEQFASRMELITNQEVLQVVKALYFDARTGKLKRGASSKGAGSPRRLSTVLRQFECTFDLYSVPSSKLLAMLPGEFSRFKSVIA